MSKVHRISLLASAALAAAASSVAATQTVSSQNPNTLKPSDDVSAKAFAKGGEGAVQASKPKTVSENPTVKARLAQRVVAAMVSNKAHTKHGRSERAHA